MHTPKNKLAHDNQYLRDHIDHVPGYAEANNWKRLPSGALFQGTQEQLEAAIEGVNSPDGLTAFIDKDVVILGSAGQVKIEKGAVITGNTRIEGDVQVLGNATLSDANILGSPGTRFNARDEEVPATTVINGGEVINGTVRDSVLNHSRVAEGARVEDSDLHAAEAAGLGADINRAILEPGARIFNQVVVHETVPAGEVRGTPASLIHFTPDPDRDALLEHIATVGLVRPTLAGAQAAQERARAEEKEGK